MSDNNKSHTSENKKCSGYENCVEVKQNNDVKNLQHVNRSGDTRNQLNDPLSKKIISML